MDVQYPSGEGLKRDVIQTTRDRQNDAYRTLLSLGHSSDEIADFNTALSYSGRPSVDAFLEHRDDFMDVGKASMALALIIHEHTSNLFTKENNWYDYLFVRMNGRFEEFGKNRLSVVTYNYERSLETYLFEALRNACGKPDKEVAEVLSRIRILHVHGQLGGLPWQSEGGREYTVTYDTAQIRDAANGIRVVSESEQIEEAFGPARALVSSADRAVFIGFGFHLENLERLDLVSRSGGPRYFGSCFGKTRLETQEIEDAFKPKGIALGEPHLKSLQFFRETIRL